MDFTCSTAKSFKFLCTEAIYDFILLLFLRCIQFATLKKNILHFGKLQGFFMLQKVFYPPKKQMQKISQVSSLLSLQGRRDQCIAHSLPVISNSKFRHVPLPAVWEPPINDKRQKR